MAGVFSIAAPLVSGIGSLFGKSKSQSVPLPPAYNVPNMTPAANSAYGIAGQINNMSPQAFQTGQAMFNNPYATDFQAGAGMAAPMGINAAMGQYAGGMNMAGQGMDLMQYIPQIMNTAFDPQHGLYDRTFQQSIEQQRAGQAARGILTSPYGAGLENDAIRNFNLDWQDRSLGRMATGSTAAGGLLNDAGRNIIGGTTLASQAPQNFLTAAGMPYTTYQGIGTDKLNALLNSSAVPQQAFEDFMSYITGGNSSNSVANQRAGLALQQAGSTFSENQTLGKGLGAAFSGLSNPTNWNWLNGMYGSGYGTGLSTGPSLY